MKKIILCSYLKVKGKLKNFCLKHTKKYFETIIKAFFISFFAVKNRGGLITGGVLNTENTVFDFTARSPDSDFLPGAAVYCYAVVSSLTKPQRTHSRILLSDRLGGVHRSFCSVRRPRPGCRYHRKHEVR